MAGRIDGTGCVQITTGYGAGVWVASQPDWAIPGTDEAACERAESPQGEGRCGSSGCGVAGFLSGLFFAFFSIFIMNFSFILERMTFLEIVHGNMAGNP